MGVWLGPGLYYLDYGPMQMTLSAFCGKQPLDQEIMDAAGYAKDLLAELATCLKVAKLPAGEIKQCPASTAVLAMMIDAVKRCPDPSLTPMAAVAGSIADSVADLWFSGVRPGLLSIMAVILPCAWQRGNRSKWGSPLI